MTLAGNVDDLDLFALEDEFMEILCAGLADCTVTLRVLSGSAVLEVLASAPEPEGVGGTVSDAALSFASAPPAEMGGRAVEAVTPPVVTTKSVDVAVAPPPPSPPPPATPPPKEDGGSDGSTLYIIIGAAGGGGCLLLLVVVAVFCVCRRRRAESPFEKGTGALLKRSPTPSVSKGRPASVSKADAKQEAKRHEQRYQSALLSNAQTHI